ncbi:SUKH-4 family immunity protein [Streptomyces anthocyanicus]|uniref:SUKH-4 family immunity protein n=1 Tax=Streptomyces anthocyanicus TaxID=68174 RepID=UPI003872BAF3|nr:SUKH-4 family immunity protein [Streptomyces anthocyanicus]WTC50538.1 SUKH-4 family immunity protein [Streptomyces anthocyanicus]
MVTFAQAQERAEEWVNGELPAYQHREVRVREFDLGFVVWAEDRADGPRSDGGAQRLVIARDSGEATLWPSLPVGEVIRRYEEEYGRPEEAQAPAAAPAARVDLNQTSFLLSPPEWLQEAADRIGIPDRRRGDGEAGATGGAGGSGGALPQTQAGVPAAPAASGPSPAEGSSGSGAGWPAAGSGSSAGGSGAGAGASGAPSAPGVPAGATPWAGTDTNADAGDDRSVPLPQTVFAPPLSGVDDDTPPPSTTSDAKTALMSGGSGLPPTALSPAIGDPNAPGAPAGAGTPPPAAPTAPPAQPPAGPGAPATPPRPLAPDAGDIADAATSKATPPPRRGGGSSTPPPPSAPGMPGARPGSTPAPSGPPAPGAPAGGYVPTQLVSSLGPEGPGGPGTPPPPSAPATPPAPGATPPPGAPGTPPPPPPSAPNAPGGTPPGGMHHAATMLADPGRTGGGAPQPPGPPGPPNPPGPPGPPGAPAAPGAPGAPGVPSGPGVPPPPPAAPGAPGAQGSAGGAGGAVHHAQTVLAAPSLGGPGGIGAPPPPPGAVPAPPGAVPPPPGQPVPGQPPAYGYPPQPTGQPTVGPGYQAVLRYRAQDGSEQQLIRRSAPGTPHPEWQMFHELRSMNVPPDQVLELHTELESCELPGAYCARMIREQWPQARITSIAPYGLDHASRQQGMGQLLAHQGELHQVADGPARPAPVRAPLPQVQPAPPVPPEAVGQELAGAFGPGVFRFEQAAVSRQGVPPVVAHTLVAAGLPMDMGPFFWAQAQPGRPVPTLAELAAERGVQPASDAGSYLVVGSDFGRAICVQYGTAAIVAVPVEAGPGGAPVPPQFVNTGLPEFARCLALLGRMWRLRFGLNQEQAGRWTVDFQAQLAALDPAALGSPESWWSVLLEQMWDGLL